jgi:sec-independent protein translocase protein TatC
MPNQTPTPESNDNSAKMSFFDHLAELRQRILYSLAALVVAALVGLYYANRIYQWLAWPMMEALRKEGAVERLVFTDPAGPVKLYIEVGVYAGVVLALPFILWQLWQFVAPGLYRHERRVVLPFVFFSTLLFLVGGVFAFFVLLPYTLRFLVVIGQPFQPMISINAYYDLAIIILFGTGLIFELPIVIFFLSLIGVVTPGFLWRNFRYAVLVIAIVAAAVTPTTDIFTMCLFMIPMLLLYLVSIGVSYFVVRRKRRAAMAAELAK